MPRSYQGGCARLDTLSQLRGSFAGEGEILPKDCHRYSPIRLICSQPSGEREAQDPAQGLGRLPPWAATSPSFQLFQWTLLH
jgi:hypothetical protein